MCQNKQVFKCLENELWWGGCVQDGIKMPYGKEDSYFTQDLRGHLHYNQGVPLLLSNKGRYIWSEEPFKFVFQNNNVIIENNGEEIIFKEGYENLKGAYWAAMKNYFPPQNKMPEELLFTAPQYNTWIELMYDQTQEGVLAYAQEMLDSQMPPGVLMIDDNWQEDYGVWEFHKARFSNPKEMIEQLHKMGFKVMLWTCPFVSPDSRAFRALEEKGALIKEKSGQIAIRKWWNGYSAVLDFTNPIAVEWYNKENEKLMTDYGVDGFKFDAGDPQYYAYEDITFEKITPNGQCEAFALNGLKYSLSEYRACWKLGNQPLAQRLSDKGHSWDEQGLASLIPNALAQGIMGYAFSCPDMIGGGQYVDFLPEKLKLDQELMVRYAQCSALFPMMQFSASPKRILDEEHFKLCVEAAHLHYEYRELFLDRVKEAAKKGEPIVRSMAYQFPEQGYDDVTEQFMLGEKILVAPVLKKGATEKTVYIPKGKWLGDDGTEVEGPCKWITPAPLNRLPRYVLKA